MAVCALLERFSTILSPGGYALGVEGPGPGNPLTTPNCIHIPNPRFPHTVLCAWDAPSSMLKASFPPLGLAPSSHFRAQNSPLPHPLSTEVGGPAAARPGLGSTCLSVPRNLWDPVQNYFLMGPFIQNFKTDKFQLRDILRSA